MKVTILCYIFPYPSWSFWPGIGRMTYELSKALIYKGVDVNVLTSYIGVLRSRLKPFDVVGGIHIYRTHMPYLWKIPLRYFSLIRSSDILQIQTFHMSHILLLKNLLPPVVSFIHHLENRSLYHHFLQFLLCHRSDVIVSNSEQTAMEYIRTFSAPKERVQIVPLGVDISRFTRKIKGGEIKSKFKGNIVLFVGTVAPRKGLEYLIRAAPLVLKEMPDTNFVIVGDKSDEQEYCRLRELSKDLGVQNNMLFEGVQTESFIHEYYAACNVFVLPSLQEGFGQVVLEAMACGKPIVSTDLPILIELTKGCGITVKRRDSEELAKAIVCLLENESLRKKLGRNARERAKEYTWEKTAERIVKIYGELLN